MSKLLHPETQWAELLVCCHSYCWPEWELYIPYVRLKVRNPRSQQAATHQVMSSRVLAMVCLTNSDFLPFCAVSFVLFRLRLSIT
jgi:hypothetical protein